MAAYTSVIQYVPDPTTNERINVGVVAFYEGDVRTRFLGNWARVRDFLGKDTPARNRIEGLFEGVDEARLRSMIETWKNSVQFTEPAGIFKPIDIALEEAARRYLVDRPIAVPTVRHHSDVLATTRSTLQAAITKRFGKRASKDIIRPKFEVVGKGHVKRRFDLGVVDIGKPSAAIQALAFEGSRNPISAAESIAFRADDVRGVVPVTVVVAPPNGPVSSYEDVCRTLASVGATVVTEDQFPDVAEKIASKLVA